MSFFLNSTFLLIASTVIAFIMATTMTIVRLKVAQSPTNIKRIIIPPIFMSTGVLMYVFPAFRISGIMMVEAIIVGALFSILLIKTTTFEIKDNEIYLNPSRSFVFILFGLLVIRIIIKLIIGSTVSFGETSGMFYLLAFTMIILWRTSMIYQYNKLRSKLE